jgi:AraC-like DNA-binding protein
MKIIFDRQAVLSATSPLMCATGGKSTLPAIEGIRIEAKHPNTCTMTTYDLEKGVQITIDANVLEEGDEAEYDVLCVNSARVFNKNSFGWDLLLDKEMNTRYENVVRGDALLVGMAEQLFASHERGDKLFTLGIFLAFFASLQRHAASQSVSHSKKDARNFEIINSALGYIHAHFDEQIKLSELAKRCFVSEPHFCRVFKAITGETAISYINNLKISKAIALMKNSTQTVKQIAEAVGFEDVAYFCRCFKKKTGAAPKAFLKQ